MLCGVVWALCVALGLQSLFAYENTPGDIGEVAQHWPATSQIRRAVDRPTLVMLAHPQCPCTRASVAELARIMAQMGGKVHAYVLFWMPKESGWDESSLRYSAAAIPGVTALSDVDGIEAERFGVETSGHTLLFNRDGHLLFSGGITVSRGHEGDNAGERALISLIRNGMTARPTTLVFGCSLGDRDKSKK